MEKTPIAIDLVAKKRGLLKILALNNEGEYMVITQTTNNLSSEDFIIIEEEDAEELLKLWKPIKETEFQIHFWRKRGQ